MEPVRLATIILFGALTAFAAEPVDRAKEMLAQQRYAEAYEALVIELDGDFPAPQVFEVAIEALLAQGKVLTANNLVKRWIDSFSRGADESGQSRAFFRGGQTSALLGERRTAAARYRRFLDLAAGKNDATAAALHFVLEHDPTPRDFRLYAGLFGGDLELRDVGAHVATQVMKQSPSAAIEFIGYLLSMYASSTDACEIFPQLRAALEAAKLDATQQGKVNGIMRDAIARPNGNRRELEAFYAGLSRWTLAPARFELMMQIQAADEQSPLYSLDRLQAALAALPATETGAAAKRVLALEPIYAGQADPHRYAAFVEMILSHAVVLQAAGDLPPERVAAMLKAFKQRGGTPEQAGEAVGRAAGGQMLSATERSEFILRHLPADSVVAFGLRVADMAPAKADAAYQSFVSTSSPSDRTRARLKLLPVYHRAGAGDKILLQIGAYLAALKDLPIAVDMPSLLYLPSGLASTKVATADAVALLAAALERDGPTASLDQILTGIEKGGGKQRRLVALVKAPEFTALRARYDEALSKSTDPLDRTRYLLKTRYPDNRTRKGRARKDIARVTQDFLKAYTGRVPAESSLATNRAEYDAGLICEAHLNHVVADPDAKPTWARIWAPRLGPGRLYAEALVTAAQGGADMVPLYLNAITNGAAPNARILWALSNVGKLGIGAAPFIPVRDARLHDVAFHVGLLQVNTAWWRDGGPEWFTDLMWSYATSGAYHPAEWDRVKSFAKCHWQYDRAGLKVKADRAVTGFLADLNRKAAHTRITAINLFIDNSREAADRLVLQHLLPLHRNLTPTGVPRANAFEYTQELLRYWINDPQASREKKAAARELRAIMTEQVILGLGRRSPVKLPHNTAGDALQWIVQRIDKKAWTDLNRTVVPYAALVIKRDPAAVPATVKAFIRPVFDKLEAAGRHELNYVMIKAANGTVPGRGEIERLLARAALNLDVVPVPRRHPSYPLHVAAGRVKRGDVAGAWEETEKRLELLQAHWKTLSRDYTVWCVGQLRRNHRYEEGLALAFEMLLSGELDPAVYARVSLAKGDIFRDDLNYDAARIEYKALHDNPLYNKTPAGREAKSRLIHLMIDTRAYANAEAVLEKMLDLPEPVARAEAYFLLGRIAFEREEYEVCREYLEQALALQPTHAEAMLLDGELRLYRDRGLEEVEIRLGEKHLRTVIVPGRALRLELPDPNLRVARQGRKVPIVVRTRPGGDIEKLDLYPSTTEKDTFRGFLPTAMDVAAPGNARLEILGDDDVTYEIDAAYQKQFGLEYAPKRMAIKADAALMASAGEILTKEEMERRRMERRLGGRGAQRRLIAARQGTIVRPGSPIYVQVTDLDRNVSAEPDKVYVRLETSSGDRLRYVIPEEGPLVGRFQEKIPTGIPFARAEASDHAEGIDPNVVIASSREGSWRSRPDGVAPKWLMVDTMTSHEVKTASIRMPQPEQVTGLSLQAGLSGAMMTIATLPPPPVEDGLLLQVVEGSSGQTISRIRAHLGRTPSVFERLTEVADGAFQRLAAPGLKREQVITTNHRGRVTARLTGAFYLNATSRFEAVVQGSYEGQAVHLLIDDAPIYSRHAYQDEVPPVPISLDAGGHRFEMLMVATTSGWQNVSAALTPEGAANPTPMPADWFSLKTHPELRPWVSPNAHLARDEGGYVATLRVPERYRKLQWTFENFKANELEVLSMRVTDAEDKEVIPVEKDFTAGLRNQILEVAPGDRITVTYHDEKRLNPNNPLLTQTLTANYADGSITLAAEVVLLDRNREESLRYFRVRRCRKGDTIMIVVNDADEDQTPGRDIIPIRVETSAGEMLELDAVETGAEDAEETGDPIHTGVYRALIRLGAATTGTTIRIEYNQTLTVSYLDRENLNPGVPVRRETSVTEAGASSPYLSIVPQKVVMRPDTSGEAAARIQRLLRKPYHRGKTNLVMLAPAVVALTNSPSTSAVYRTSVDAPIDIRVTHPAEARHAASEFKFVRVVAQSELDAAREEGRAPDQRDLACDLVDIEAGIFGTRVNLHVGTKDDVVTETDRVNMEEEDIRLRSPRTLFVQSGDTVWASLIDAESNETSRTAIELAADATLHLLDRSFEALSDSVHLGERLYVRLRDRDRDETDQRDKVRIEVSTGSGHSAEVQLEETFGRSGVFDGRLRPVVMAETNARSAIAGAEVKADPGDVLTFSYVDARRILEKDPLAIAATGHVKPGAHGELASFSKRFADPEMAVKTSFLMAEALFEMAKDRRKLGDMEKAEDLIAQGKRVLEEAMRDFPETSLVARGEFLLANLAQELERYDEAIHRYATVVSTWPDSDFAPRALFKLGICHEKKGDIDASLENYVRLTYIYETHTLAADAIVRLASYYYKNAHFETSARIFTKFQEHHPEHRLAAKSLALAGLSHIKGENFDRAMQSFEKVITEYPDNKAVRSEAMYWLGDSATQARDYAQAYRAFKQLTWDYPESKWAKMARGRLTENILIGAEDNE